MSREVRMVKAGWEHPKNHIGHYDALNADYKKTLEEFEKKAKELGMGEALDYFGGGPLSEEYMPHWEEEEKTHYMMYETCTEGTPISPSFDSPEKLAKWLADNHASTFGDMTGTYEQWLNMIKARWAPSAIMVNGVMKSGVEVM